MDKKEPLASQLDPLGSASRGEGYELGNQTITASSIKQSDKKMHDIFIYIHANSRISDKCAVLNLLRVAKGREIVTVLEGDDEYAC
jgi:hypothetical protein